jgi:predicted dehydrogenase
MNAPIGIGYLSFAHGHVGAYADAMKDFSDVRQIIGYDDNPERGRSVCESAGMAYTPHPEDVLNHPEVQAVAIGSETCYHADLAVAAAEAGKAILLQKPMALTLEDCDRIIAAAEKTGVHFSMAFQMRHDPANQRIKAIVESGALGDIAVIRRRHCIGVCLVEEFINSPAHWHLEAEKNKGMFMDDAAHPADWFHWTFGKPVSVMAEIGNLITDCAPDDNGIALYRFQDGSLGELFNSATVIAGPGENTTEIFGSKGCLVQNYGDGPCCAVPRLAGNPALKVFHYGEPEWDVQNIEIPADQGVRIRAVPRPWIDSLIQETDPPASAADGRIACEMVLGAYQSASEGRRVSFPL